MRCPVCGQKLKASEATCPRCASKLQETATSSASPTQAPIYVPTQERIIQMQPGTHSVAVAVLFSLFCFLGLGQGYNKQTGKAMVIALASIFLGICTIGLAVFIIWPVALIDAAMIAKRLNRGEAVGENKWF